LAEPAFISLFQQLTDLEEFRILDLIDILGLWRSRLHDKETLTISRSVDKQKRGCVAFQEMYLVLSFLAAVAEKQTRKFLCGCSLSVSVVCCANGAGRYIFERDITALLTTSGAVAAADVLRLTFALRISGLYLQLCVRGSARNSEFRNPQRNECRNYSAHSRLTPTAPWPAK
jgi:hypothetical protein